MQNALRNWKTSLFAVLILVVVIAYLVQAILDHKPIDITTILTAIGGVLVSGALFTAKDSDKTGTAAGGFVRTPILLALVLVTLVAASCAWMQKASVSGTVDGKNANVTLTAPDGTPYAVTVANQTACLQGGTFVEFGKGSNMSCNGACAQRVAGGGTLTLYCRFRLADGTYTQPFPFQVAVPL